MSIPDPVSNPELSPTGDLVRPTPARPDVAPPGSFPSGRDWAWVLSVSMAAALLTWGLGESGWLRVKPTDAVTSMMGRTMNGSTGETRQVAATRTAGLVYASFGALLGAGLALAGGMAGGRPRRVVVAAAVGAAVGGVVGAGASMAVFTAFHRMAGDHAGDLVPAFAMHASVWAPLGAAAGLALGLGRRGPGGLLAAAIGGIAGALVGALVYEGVGAFAFPLDETTTPVSTSAITRLLNFLLLAVTASIGALLGLREQRAGVRA